jgi:flavin reductase (DIM6/NTAB) family NADH-FMN oxidoreductase RutF
VNEIDQYEVRESGQRKLETRHYEAIDLAEFSEENRYKFMTGSVVPRPIALVTSLGETGVLNAAPFSQFVIISVSPPLLGIVAHDAHQVATFSATPGIYKDTVRNVMANGEFVINTVTETMALQVQECAFAFPPDVSEIDQVGFHTIPSVRVAPARIAESLIQFECRLHRLVPFGDENSKTTLVVGEVVTTHCADGILSGHRVDHEKLRPLGRIAGRNYCRTTDVIQV